MTINKLVTLVSLFLALVTAVAQQHHPDHMDHRFENPAEWAKSFDNPARDAWQMPDKVIAALHLKPGQSVADLGAGTGYFTMRLAKSDPSLHVLGVDIEQSMVDYLQARAAKERLTNVQAVKASADAANLPAPVDLILIVDTYHHLPQRTAYFRRLADSLKPEGRIAIIDFKPDAHMGPPKEFRLTAEQIRTELAPAGFRMTEQLAFLPEQQFLIFTKGR